MALPAASERLSHGMPAFRVADVRMFAYFWCNHHGDGLTAVCVKTSGREEQELLLQMDPGYRRLPYLGAAGWIGIDLEVAGLDWDHVAARVSDSHRLVAPPRLFGEVSRKPAGRR